MRCAVIVFPGSNCDSDLSKAVNAFKGVDAKYVWYTKIANPKEDDIKTGYQLAGGVMMPQFRCFLRPT